MSINNLVVYNRVLKEANDFKISKTATVRSVAKLNYVSKSTVYRDLTEILPFIDEDSYKIVKEKLEENKLSRHIRGGEATKKKYLKMGK